MIKARLGHRIDGWIHALFPFLFRRALDPSLLTIAGALICVGAAVAFARGAFGLGGLLLLAGGFFDLVDGVVARHQGLSSAFGAFLDSTTDRLVDMAVLFGIAMHYGAAGRSDAMLLAGVVLVTSVLTSYTRARVEQLGGQIAGGFMERGERIGLLAAGGILGWMLPALWLLAAGGTLTVAQRFRAAHRELDGAKPPGAPAGAVPIERARKGGA